MGEGRAARKAGGAVAAWHPLWLKWRVSLGETHLPVSALSQGNQSHTLAEDRGCRPRGVILMPPCARNPRPTVKPPVLKTRRPDRTITAAPNAAEIQPAPGC